MFVELTTPISCSCIQWVHTLRKYLHDIDLILTHAIYVKLLGNSPDKTLPTIFFSHPPHIRLLAYSAFPFVFPPPLFLNDAFKNTFYPTDLLPAVHILPWFYIGSKGFDEVVIDHYVYGTEFIVYDARGGPPAVVFRCTINLTADQGYGL